MMAMATMHPTLLIGPADWDPARLPRNEFLGRIAAFWRAADPGIGGVAVYGSPRDHAELAYLTHATPKLEPIVALIPRAGEPRLLVGGGANMIGAAKPLTWVENLLPLRDVGQTIARWARETGPLALINGGAMRFGLRQEIEAALGTAPPDVTGLLAAAMRRKSARELALIREACAGVQATIAAMRDAQRAGRGMTDTVLAGERAAWRGGAQDVRTLFGRDGLGPFTLPDAGPADPMQAYAAVRHDGYWAEGLAPLSRSPQPAMSEANGLLAQAIARMKPGARRSDIGNFLRRSIGADRVHPVTRDDFGGAIGLDLPNPGCFNGTDGNHLAAGEVYTMRVGLHDAAGAAVVSAMVVITEGGHDLMWPGADA